MASRSLPVAALVALTFWGGAQGLSSTAAFHRLAAPEALPESAPAVLQGCAGFECVQRYVDTPDPAYAWHELPGQALAGELAGVGWKGHVLSMVSQRWLAPKDTNHPVWTHPLVVIVPEASGGCSGGGPAKAQEWSTLLVGGAQLNEQDVAAGVSAELPDVQSAIYLATRTCAVAAVVLQVPNQPFAFSADPARTARTEDEIKAYTWRHFLDQPGDAEWPIELPSAKAAVRAMDTVTSFLGQQGRSIKRFGLSGCSKRANAALMACGHDPRCELLMPCAMSGNTPGLMAGMMRSMGGTELAAKDYVANHVFDDPDEPEIAHLFGIIDSQSYASKLTMPKLWLNCASDDFFFPDHTALFWEDLPSPKYLFQRENAGHAGSLTGFNAPKGFLAPAAAFTNAILLDQPLPQITWKIDNATGEIVVQQLDGPAPSSVVVWSARSCKHSPRRDFRKITLDAAPQCLKCGTPIGPLCDISRSTQWAQRERLDANEKLWRVSVPTPSSGWEAFYVTFEFPPPVAHGDPLQVSTEASVVPFGRYPFPECHGKNCKGANTLVLLDEGSSGRAS